MKIEDALMPGVEPDAFFMECVPELFEARRELFAESCETEVIVSVHLTDLDARYTCEFSEDGCVVERGEMIDFPVATIVGQARHWEDFKRHVLSIVVTLEQRAHARRANPDKAPPSKLTREFLEHLERFDGVFACELSAEDLDDPIPVQVILNDYEAPDGAPTLRIGASFETGEQLARDEIRPADLESRVRVGGELSLGLEVGGLLLKHFPELEGRS
jgi:hypothetical protein